jgi:DNA-binding MarR family transcriptional regulator
MKFRRVANVALRPVGISFAEWRVLEAAWRIIRRTDEPASHLDVSRELELDEGCVSRLMYALSWRSFVSHDIDGLGLSYRVRLTVSGKEAVAKAYAVVARVAARELGE